MVQMEVITALRKLDNARAVDLFYEGLEEAPSMHRVQLESSLARESPIDLPGAIAEHRRLALVRMRAQADPTGEILVARPGSESEGDLLENGHTSTSIPRAMPR